MKVHYLGKNIACGCNLKYWSVEVDGINILVTKHTDLIGEVWAATCTDDRRCNYELKEDAIEAAKDDELEAASAA